MPLNVRCVPLQGPRLERGWQSAEGKELRARHACCSKAACDGHWHGLNMFGLVVLALCGLVVLVVDLAQAARGAVVYFILCVL